MPNQLNALLIKQLRRQTPEDDLTEKTPSRLASLDRLWLFCILLVLAGFFGLTHPHQFVSTYNITSIATNASILLILAVGQTFVIITAGIDLSVGSVLVFSSVVAAQAMNGLGGKDAAWSGIVLGMLVALGAGLLWGLVNGFLIARLNIPPLIVTLGTLGMALGIAELMTHGIDISSIPTQLQSGIGFTKVFEIPTMVIIAACVAVLGGILLRQTTFGRHTYAIGSNVEAANRAGINVRRKLICVYALQGVLGGVAGILSLARFGTTVMGGHSGDNLIVITGVVLGGASLFGGAGLMTGTVIGILLPATLQNGLIIMGVQPFWEDVVTGAILIAAVYVDQLRRSQRSRAA